MAILLCSGQDRGLSSLMIYLQLKDFAKALAVLGSCEPAMMLVRAPPGHRFEVRVNPCA